MGEAIKYILESNILHPKYIIDLEKQGGDQKMKIQEQMGDQIMEIKEQVHELGRKRLFPDDQASNPQPSKKHAVSVPQPLQRECFCGMQRMQNFISCKICGLKEGHVSCMINGKCNGCS